MKRDGIVMNLFACFYSRLLVTFLVVDVLVSNVGVFICVSMSFIAMFSCFHFPDGFDLCYVPSCLWCFMSIYGDL